MKRPHDVPSANEHVPQVDKFVAGLREAVNTIHSSPNEGRYKEVHVLILSWEDDNLGVKKESASFEAFFQDYITLRSMSTRSKERSLEEIRNPRLRLSCVNMTTETTYLFYIMPGIQ